MMSISLEHMSKRLSAIMVADVAGFSRLMEQNESLTFARLRRLREEVNFPKVEEYGGRIIKTTGDGFLAEFPSAISSVECAIAIQQEVMQLEKGLSDSERICFRIGINIGDIIIDGSDVAGDAVNIAARLESLSPLNGMCLSALVRSHLNELSDIQFEDIGPQQLKNISRAIHAFIARLSDQSSSQNDKLSSARADSPAIQKLSVLVLPFKNMSGDPTQEFFSDGITDDITTQLSSIKGSYVVDRATAQAYKNKSADVKSLGRELGVRYILQGRIDQFDEGVDTDLQLSDTVTGAVIWKDAIEVDRRGVRNIRKEVIKRMASALNLTLITAAASNAEGNSSESPELVDLVMRGWAAYFHRTNVSDHQKAAGIFSKALELEPRSSSALIGRAATLAAQAFSWGSEDRPSQIAQAEADVLSGLKIDDGDSYGHFALARVRFLQGRIESAVAENELALELNPNLVEAVAWAGTLKFCAGQPEDSLNFYRAALTQSPHDPFRWSWLAFTGGAYLLLGNYSESIRWLEKSLTIFKHWVTLTYLVSAYAHIGDLEKAEIAKEELLKVRPNLSVSFLDKFGFSQHPDYLHLSREHLYPGLRLAGFSD
jgi:class 3 adenylate cyclase